ncbi:hypothetical protein SEA_COLUCCI_34 [Arthrobacter phage Colucci]|uniref:Uncharacterized protein n=1 Tax=Arthrobacter phage Colucci TaxID=2015834 RepID=A0A286N2U8_9CAUD|nr:hypothetical protein FDI27_gp034 [Arthrobacter phage Colucci]ASX98705.1 hypothetical protein SEA_COLUCCI_34 [Arthrobacter phage Colucci]
MHALVIVMLVALVFVGIRIPSAIRYDLAQKNRHNEPKGTTMKSTKTASEIIPGDKIFTTDSPNKPLTVTASYPLGDRWGLEVDGVRQILQVEATDTVTTWGN